MKRLIINIGLLLFATGLFAQSALDIVLGSVEKNNKTLIALRSQIEADKLNNKTGIYLDNPQVTLNYLYENPDISGPRTDFSIVQGFDFPSSYKYRSQIANMRNDQLELTFQKERKSVLMQTKLVCYDIIYANAVIKELSKNYEYLTTYAKLTKEKFEKGEVNILDYNKSKMNVLAVGNEIKMKQLEKQALLADLGILNGGEVIEYSDSTFTFPNLPTDFEQWYTQAAEHNPILVWLKQEIEIKEKQAQLNRSMTLPTFQAGYMSEKIIGQDYKGFTLGMSIPLWENKNTVKYAKANKLAMENTALENQNQIYNELKRLHTSALQLYQITSAYKKELTELDNTEHLKKALDQGEISLIVYSYEMSTYYEFYFRLIGLERDLNRAVAELNKYM